MIASAILCGQAVAQLQPPYDQPAKRVDGLVSLNPKVPMPETASERAVEFTLYNEYGTTTYLDPWGRAIGREKGLQAYEKATSPLSSMTFHLGTRNREGQLEANGNNSYWDYLGYRQVEYAYAEVTDTTAFRANYYPVGGITKGHDNPADGIAVNTANTDSVLCQSNSVQIWSNNGLRYFCANSWASLFFLENSSLTPAGQPANESNMGNLDDLIPDEYDFDRFVDSDYGQTFDRELNSINAIVKNNYVAIRYSEGESYDRFNASSPYYGINVDHVIYYDPTQVSGTNWWQFDPEHAICIRNSGYNRVNGTSGATLPRLQYVKKWGKLEQMFTADFWYVGEVWQPRELISQAVSKGICPAGWKAIFLIAKERL